MMRFVIVQNSLRTVLKFRLTYIKKLLEFGDVYVIAPNDDQYSYTKLISLGVKVYFVSDMNTFLGKIKAIFQMNYFILKERIKGSVFISHFLITFILCYFSLVPLNSRLIIYVEGLGSIFTKKNFLRNILKVFLVKNKAKRLFCNESERSLIGLNNDVVTNGIGVDINKFKPSSTEKSKSYFTLLFVGRLIKDKGIFDVIDAFRELTNTNTNIKMLIAGDVYINNPTSLTHEDIDNIKAEFGNHIEFLGYLNNVEEIYNRADILLIPSIREGFPVCVMEASAMGIPSIGYKVPGVQDAIRDNINGLLSDFGSHEQLVYNIGRLLDRKYLDASQIRCRQYALENFDSNVKSDELVRYLLSL